MSGKGHVYLDTCIFISQFNGEIRDDPLERAGVEELERKISAEEIDIVTSVITFTEVLESGVLPEAREKLERMFWRPNCLYVGVDRQIAEIAHDIRDFYRKKQEIDGLPTVTTPDALHLATAIRRGCPTFYTFDKNDKQKKSRGLIPLGPMVADKYSLSIEKPTPEGGQLPLVPR